MSFVHKAFAFDWRRFEQELAAILRRALESGDASSLAGYIESNLELCSDPYEGEPLTVSWRSQLEAGDVQELADFALTKYYRPSEDFGLGDEWAALSPSLPSAVSQSFLGEAFGPAGKQFDPGRMGSYFQSPIAARASRDLLATVQPANAQVFLQGISIAVSKDQGVYVTF